MTSVDLRVASVIEIASGVVRDAIAELKKLDDPEVRQVIMYELAHAASATETARGLLDYGQKEGEYESRITAAFVADRWRTSPAETLRPGGRWEWPPALSTAPGTSWPATATPTSWPRWPTTPATATSTPISSWCRTRSAASPRSR
ncbi:MAG: hypothetical protein R2749_21460 [Acidimicrobiales bacterium]